MTTHAKLLAAVLAACTGTFLVACSREQARQGANPTEVKVQLDWIPSAEYYGFFYARAKGIYASRGLHVTLSYGTGAPQVAAELSAGAVSVGTTTSDDLARQIARGAKFAAAAALLPYNPNAIGLRPEIRFVGMSSLQDKTIGVNEQSVAYQQFRYLAATQGLAGNYRKYPIGYGGANELLSGRVDAFLGYSTNQVLLARSRNPAVKEITFDQLGLHSYGLVVALGTAEKLQGGLQTYNRFLAATKSGYDDGAKDIDGAVRALKEAEPTLDAKQLRAAIQRVTQLRAAKTTAINDLDSWLLSDGVPPSAIGHMRSLLAR